MYQRINPVPFRPDPAHIFPATLSSFDMIAEYYRYFRGIEIPGNLRHTPAKAPICIVDANALGCMRIIEFSAAGGSNGEEVSPYLLHIAGSVLRDRSAGW